MFFNAMSYCDISNSQHPMLAYETALQEALASVSVKSSSTSLPLSQALGRVLAYDVLSPMDMPPFSQSAMDGYALLAADLESTNELSVVGKSFAGHPYSGAIASGECVRIMTGAVLPEGCDSVIMQEKVSVDGDSITIASDVNAGQCVRAKGHEYRAGDVALKRGTPISARHIALLASMGFKEVEVFELLTVAIFSTGDELIELGELLAAGQIYDSNRYSLIAQLEKLNCRVLDYGIIPDCVTQIEQAFSQANSEADVVITSGGVSVGEADYTKEVLDKLGNIEFWKVAVKPGKPLAFGYLSDSVFLGLPGNPVSAMVTFDKVAKPVLKKLAGEIDTPQMLLAATCKTLLRKNVGRLEFQRGFAATDDNGNLVVETTGGQGSGMVGSMCAANCYIVLPQMQGDIAAGETVMIELFSANLQA
ncbi:MAG: gephyrin-like molybdotransferase Glp [Psychrobium sp.]